jgi:hypothetical protein
LFLKPPKERGERRRREKKKKKPLNLLEEQKVKRESKGGKLIQTRNSKSLFNFFFIDNLLLKLVWGLKPSQNPYLHTD